MGQCHAVRRRCCGRPDCANSGHSLRVKPTRGRRSTLAQSKIGFLAGGSKRMRRLWFGFVLIALMLAARLGGPRRFAMGVCDLIRVAQSPQVANMPMAATAITAVASQPKALSSGRNAN